MYLFTKYSKEEYYMLKQEEQKFDLLGNLRKTAEKGKKIVRKAILQSSGESVSISNTFVKVSELEELERLLQKAEQAKSINELRVLLNEDSIPVELVITDQFWGNFQRLIYNLCKEDIER